MTQFSRRDFVLTSLGAVIAPGASFAAASDYPNRPVRLIVAFPAGGNMDALARIVANGMSYEFGQRVVVENKPGANGIIGTEEAARAAPDGYTMLMVSVEHVLNASVYKSLPYDPIRDFSAISDLATQSYALAVNPALHAKRVKDVVALAKRRPGALTFASWGTGSLGELAGDMLETRGGIRMMEVPYKGGPPAIADLLAHRVDMMFTSFSNILSFVRAGRLSVVGVTSKQRAKVLPEVPTFKEQGYDGFVIGSWRGLVFPAKTPSAIIEKTNKVVHALLSSADVRNRLTNMGFEILGSTPQAFEQLMVNEEARWQKIARQANVRAHS
jgi:tripartite-type tricarboxylate transporter receptor subunit TctC